MATIVKTAQQEQWEQRHGARVLRMDFAAFLADREGSVARIAEHFGITTDAAARAQALSPALLGRYAKATEHPYDAQARAADLAEAARRFAPELRAALAFTERLRARYPALDPLASGTPAGS